MVKKRIPIHYNHCLTQKSFQVKSDPVGSLFVAIIDLDRSHLAAKLICVYILFDNSSFWMNICNP